MSARRYRVRKEIRRVKRRNAFFLMIALASVLLLITVFAVEPATKSAEEKEPRYVEVTVNPGDTLWDIAVRYGDPQKDVRKTVWEMEKVNHISNATLYVGDTVFVPVQ